MDLPDLTPEQEEAIAERVALRKGQAAREEANRIFHERARRQDDLILDVLSRLTACPACGEEYADPRELEQIRESYDEYVDTVKRHCGHCQQTTYVTVDVDRTAS